MADTTELLSRQQRFVDEYVKDLNATQAALRAGYSDGPSARVTSPPVMKKPAARTAISDAMVERRTRTQIDADHVLTQLEAIKKIDVAVLADGSKKVTLELHDRLRCLDPQRRHLRAGRQPDTAASDIVARLQTGRSRARSV